MFTQFLNTSMKDSDRTLRSNPNDNFLIINNLELQYHHLILKIIFLTLIILMIEKPSLLGRPLPKILFFETTGTMILAYGIAMSGMQGYPTDIFVSVALFAAICWAGQLTGGHFNPAVTIGAKVVTGIQYGWAYILSHYLGAFLGALLSYYVSRYTISPYDPANAKEIIADVCSEIVGTFAFVLSILIVTTKSTTFVKKPLYVYTFIPISMFICRRLCAGAGVNPAVTVMGSLVNVICNNGPFKYFWIQGISPLIGALLAGLFFKFFYHPMIIYYKISTRRKSV